MKFQQLIPAVGWELVYINEEGELDCWPCVGFALDSDGFVVPLDTNGASGIVNASGLSNYVGIKHESTLFSDFEVEYADRISELKGEYEAC